MRRAPNVNPWRGGAHLGVDLRGEGAARDKVRDALPRAAHDGRCRGGRSAASHDRAVCTASSAASAAATTTRGAAASRAIGRQRRSGRRAGGSEAGDERGGEGGDGRALRVGRLEA